MMQLGKCIIRHRSTTVILINRIIKLNKIIQRQCTLITIIIRIIPDTHSLLGGTFYLERMPTLNRYLGNCTGFGTTSIFLSGRDFARNIE